MKPKGGQCADNSDVGNWYSLPAAGVCPADQPLSLANNCTWRIKERVKTIDGDCVLKEHNMVASCLAERHVPFTKTAAIFEKAFKFDEKSKGGCPNIVPLAAAEQQKQGGAGAGGAEGGTWGGRSTLSLAGGV